MTAKEIYKYYELMIEDIEDENKKDELFEKLEKIDDLLRPFEKELNAELDKQDSMFLPTQTEYREDFESSREAIML